MLRCKDINRLKNSKINKNNILRFVKKTYSKNSFKTCLEMKSKDFNKKIVFERNKYQKTSEINVFERKRVPFIYIISIIFINHLINR